MSFCSWCDKKFYAKSSKQIYCSPECRQEASKEKIFERYEIEKRRKRVGRDKKCAGGCGTYLSIYNDVGMCDNCLINKKKFNNFIKELKGYFEYKQE
jgi:hypothetical protein